MPSDLISVIIPCYNQAHFLGEAIESLLGQTYSNVEVIVVNDGSTDDTVEVAARYPGVRCLSQKNQGLSAARNAGIRASQGGYLVFLDADDRLRPEALETGVEYLRRFPECAFVYGRHQLIAVDGSPLPTLQEPTVEGDHYLALLRDNYIGMHATVMYRRAVFDAVGDFNAGFRACEDYDLYLRIAKKFPVYGHEKVVAEYRQHDSSMSRDPALMLKFAMAVMRAQQPYIRGDRQYENAYRAGVKVWRQRYGDRLSSQLRAGMERPGQWRRALRDRMILLRYHPTGFLRYASPALHCLRYQLLDRIRNGITRRRRLASGCSTGTISANPNPIRVSDKSRVGITTLSWTSSKAETVEVRVGAPDGLLFSQTGPSGAALTGEWVRDGMVFYLQDVSHGLPLTAEHTLATVTVNVIRAKRPAENAFEFRLFIVKLLILPGLIMNSPIF
jgi:glycosyltransferase involved in cell wall biosynthesis